MDDGTEHNQQSRALVAWVPVIWRSHFRMDQGALPRGRFPLLAALLVLCLPAMLLYPWRTFHLFEPDESRYAQIPREMLASGDWVVPTLQGEPYLDKPPLLYWLVALSYRVLGVTPEAARLVPALCVHLTILAVFLIGRRSIGTRAAMWAALLLTVSPLFIGVARLLLLDGLLTLCVTASVLCGFEAVRTGRLHPGWWIASAVASGLGFLTKGPISEILLFPPLLAYAWLQGGTARVGLRWLAIFAGIVLGVNLPWYVAMLFRAPDFLTYFFWEHNVMRFLQPFDHLQPVWYYVPILLGGFLPGTLLFVPMIREALWKAPGVRTILTPAGGFWLLAGMWCVFFFSLSGSKLPTYILPAFPFLSLAVGEYIARSRWDAARGTRVLIGSFAVGMLVLHSVGIPWYARERSPVGKPQMLEPYVTDPKTPVVTYPRNCDSVAYLTGRNDFDRVRSKDVNQLMVDMHHRPKTVILFTHRHSYEAFRQALPESLAITSTVSFRRPTPGVPGIDQLVGETPWGLADLAVVEPAWLARGQ